LHGTAQHGTLRIAPSESEQISTIDFPLEDYDPSPAFPHPARHPCYHHAPLKAKSKGKRQKTKAKAKAKGKPDTLSFAIASGVCIYIVCTQKEKKNQQ